MIFPALVLANSGNSEDFNWDPISLSPDYPTIRIGTGMTVKVLV
jgi:hypothetical protein